MEYRSFIFQSSTSQPATLFGMGQRSFSTAAAASPPAGNFLGVASKLLTEIVQTVVDAKALAVPEPTTKSHCDTLKKKFSEAFVIFESQIIKYSPECPRRQRTYSEQSDDFIVFDDSNDNSAQSSEEESTDSESQDDYEVKPAVCQVDRGFSEDNPKKTAKVKFNLVPKVHHMYAWQFAYRMARKGDWEQLSLDEARFKRRIRFADHMLNPVLNATHRQQVYASRFAEDSM